MLWGDKNLGNQGFIETVFKSDFYANDSRPYLTVLRGAKALW
jgi:hypothetical protein